MPLAACPGTAHHSAYEPCSRSTLSTALSPGWISFVFAFTPAPAIDSECGYLPVFLISKRTRPLCACFVESEILYSRSVTRIVALEEPAFATT